ncbi:MAG: IPT/TIG domain-containing protein, partial [Planctomycetota bacterium JB042]
MRALAPLPLLAALLAPAARGADDDAAWLAEAEAAVGVTGASLVQPEILASTSAGPGGASLDVVVELDGSPVALALAPRSLRSPAFQLLVVDGDEATSIPPPPSATYRGTAHVPGAEGYGTVTASVGPDGLTAFVVRPDGARFVLRPLAGLVDGAPDGTLLAYPAGAAPPSIAPELAAFAAGSTVVELGIDCDVEYYQANGGTVIGTLADVETVMNEVSAIFDRDAGVVFELTTVVVRTSEPDPYTFTIAAALQNQFKSEWSNSLGAIHRDLAHLITGRDLDGSVRGAAFTSSVCSMSSGYSVSETTYTANLATRAATTAHYLAMNFGAGTCDGDADCQIMCSTIGGCAGVAGFGAQSQTKIQSVAAGIVCGSSHPGTQLLPFADAFPSPTVDTSKWVVIDGPVIDASAPSPPSPGGALKLSAAGSGAFDDHEIRTTTLDLTGNASATLRFEERRQGVESGEALVAEISVGGALWAELLRVTSNGVDPGGWTTRSVDLPAPSLVDGVRVRIRGEMDEANDAWWIDDLEIIEIDVTPPTLGTLSLTPSPWPPASSMTVSIPITDDLSGVGTVTCSVKDGPTTVDQITLSHAGGGTYSGSFGGGLAEKTYDVVLDALDQQENAAQTAGTIEVMDDPVCSAPQLGPDPALDGDPVVASVLVTDSSAIASVTATGSVNGGAAVPIGLSFDSGSGRYEGTFPAFGTPGTLSVTFVAVDVAGHSSSPAQETLTLYDSSGAPPSVGTPSVTPNPVAAGSSLSVSATVTDPDTPLVSVTARIVQSSSVKHQTPMSKGSGNTWSATFASTPQLVAGPFTVEVVANDLEGNSTTKTRAATAFEAPTITSIQTAPSSFDADDPFEVTAIVTHPVGVQSATASVSLNGGAFSDQAMAFHAGSGRYRASYPAPGGGGTLTIRVTASSTDGHDAPAVETTASVGYLPVTLAEVDPGAGPLGGGTTVVVRGTGMSVDVEPGSARILFGGVDATSVQVVSDDELQGVLPAHAAGTVGVEVRVTKGGVVRSDTLASAFQYGTAPTLASIEPDHGGAFGPTTVVLKGTGLSGDGGAGAITVSVGGRAAAVDVLDDQTVLAEVPAGEDPGAVEAVTVTTSFGSVSLPAGFRQVGAALRRVDHVGLSEPPAAFARISDVDLDGVRELAVGVPDQGSGVVAIRSGTDLSSIANLTSPSSSPGRFGEALATVADADADGAVDLVVGEPGRSSSRGAVHLIGSSSGTPVWTHAGTVASSEVGASLAVLGDLNGDGFDEIAAGAPGRNEVRVLDGQSGASLLVLPGPDAGAAFGRVVHAVPFGPGRDDAALVIGAPSA